MHPMSSSIIAVALALGYSCSLECPDRGGRLDYLSPGGGYLSFTDEFSDEEEAVGEKLKRSRQCRERVHKSREKGYYFELMRNKSRRPAA